MEWRGVGAAPCVRQTCERAPPTEEGSADAMLAKMSTEVPLPSFSSVMTSATWHTCAGRGAHQRTRATLLGWRVHW